MSATETARYSALMTHLLMAVPLSMMTLAERGGPDADDMAAAIAYSDDLAEHGDDLIFGGGDRSSRELVAGLVRAIAVLAYAPGGITLFGQHWEAGESPVYGRADR